MTTVDTPSSLSEAVAAVEPVIREYAATAEEKRVMAPEIIEALVSSGLLRMWVPRAYGGLEAAPNESLDVMERLARIDAATGWVVSNCVFITTICQFLPENVRARIVGDPHVVACGSFVPPGAARVTDDGYIINGNWSFGSAIQYATSIVVLNLLVDGNGDLVLQEGNPVSVVAFLHADDVEFQDTWHTLGLRGTGSVNFTATDLAVPRDHTYLLGPWQSEEGPFSGPLYRLGLIMDAVRIAKVGVGIAQGAVDDFSNLATTKTPAYTTTITADRATVQERVARAQALVQAGREYSNDSIGRLERSAGWQPNNGRTVHPDGLGRIVRARCGGAGCRSPVPVGRHDRLPRRVTLATAVSRRSDSTPERHRVVESI